MRRAGRVRGTLKRRRGGCARKAGAPRALGEGGAPRGSVRPAEALGGSVHAGVAGAAPSAGGQGPARRALREPRARAAYNAGGSTFFRRRGAPRSTSLAPGHGGRTEGPAREDRSSRDRGDHGSPSGDGASTAGMGRAADPG